MLKKTLLTSAMTLGLFAGSVTPSNALETPRDGWDVLDAVIMWLPNLAVNILDTFTLEVGAGPTAKLGVKVTQACNIGYSWCEQKPAFVWGPNRQFGGCIDNGYSASFMPFTIEKVNRKVTSREVYSYENEFNGVPLPTEEIYDFFVGPRNYWGIGVYGGAFIDGVFEVNLDQVADLATSIFFLDIKGDWLTMEQAFGVSLRGKEKY